jgi:DNA-binding MarR family transcriptional regulator
MCNAEDRAESRQGQYNKCTLVLATVAAVADRVLVTPSPPLDWSTSAIDRYRSERQAPIGREHAIQRLELRNLLENSDIFVGRQHGTVPCDVLTKPIMGGKPEAGPEDCSHSPIWAGRRYRLESATCTGNFMSLTKLYANPGYLVRRLEQISVAIFLRELKEYGITPVQYMALSTIRDRPGLDIQTLADLIATDRSTLGSVINRFHLKGLVERNSSPDDRRLKLVRISPAGETLIDRVEPKVGQAQNEIFDVLSQSERSEFLAILRTLAEVNNGYSRAPAVGAGAQPLSCHETATYVIRRLQQICDGIFLSHTARFDITPVQYSGLIAIAAYQGIDSSALANLIAIDKATAGSVSRRLQVKGWIEVDINNVDRRAVCLRPTKLGVKCLRDLAPIIKDAGELLTKSLAPAAEAMFYEKIERVVTLKNDHSRAPYRPWRPREV